MKAHLHCHSRPDEDVCNIELLLHLEGHTTRAEAGVHRSMGRLTTEATRVGQLDNEASRNDITCLALVDTAEIDLGGLDGDDERCEGYNKALHGCQVSQVVGDGLSGAMDSMQKLILWSREPLWDYSGPLELAGSLRLIATVWKRGPIR